jgi:hypothetical protein
VGAGLRTGHGRGRVGSLFGVGENTRWEAKGDSVTGRKTSEAEGEGNVRRG